jgi:hypothetical protein
VHLVPALRPSSGAPDEAGRPRGPNEVRLCTERSPALRFFASLSRTALASRIAFFVDCSISRIHSSMVLRDREAAVLAPCFCSFLPHAIVLFNRPRVLTVTT